MAQVVSRKYSALFDFENEADAREAATLIEEPYRADATLTPAVGTPVSEAR
jgi:hypothetical protein